MAGRPAFSNENLRRILCAALKSAIKALNSGETIVEIAGQATEIGLKLKV